MNWFLTKKREPTKRGPGRPRKPPVFGTTSKNHETGKYYKQTTIGFTLAPLSLQDTLEHPDSDFDLELARLDLPPPEELLSEEEHHKQVREAEELERAAKRLKSFDRVPTFSELEDFAKIVSEQ